MSFDDSSIGDGRPTTTETGSAGIDPTASDATVPADDSTNGCERHDDNNSVTGLADDHNRAVDAGSPVRRPDPSGAGHHQPSDTAPCCTGAAAHGRADHDRRCRRRPSHRQRPPRRQPLRQGQRRRLCT